MKKIIFGLLLLAIGSCNEKPKSVFSLNARTDNIENGTVLYLVNTSTSEVMDSTTVQNNSFEFKNALPHSPVQTLLHTKGYKLYRYIWLENSTMTFDATTKGFNKASITGSKSEDLSQALHKKLDSLSRDERQKVQIEFIKDHPNSIVGANMLYVYSTSWGKEIVSGLFDKLSNKNKSSVYGKKIDKYLSLNKNLKIGDRFVDFEMADQDGDLRKLSDLKGKTVLLEFWASWCSPCRKENVNLVKTYEKFNPWGFEVFAVTLDQQKEAWLKAIEDDGLNWQHVNDFKGSDSEAALIYGISGIPDNYLIDENGIIIGRKLRGEKLNEKLMEIMPVPSSQ